MSTNDYTTDPSKNTSHDTDIVIPLTRGQSTVISSEDADLALLKWCTFKSTTGRCYAMRRIPTGVKGKQSTLYLHRVILERKLGRALESGELTDHKDRDGLNNRRDNLRPATYSQNTRNSSRAKTKTTAQYTGVFPSASGWKAALFDHSINKRKILGDFKTEEMAGAAYNRAIKIRDGEFASYNNIPGWEDMPLIKAVSRVRAKSGYRYVYFSKFAGRWTARVKDIHLGYFDTAEEANQAVIEFLNK